MNAKPRRWFRFSLRTLFVLVTVLCCWLGWESRVVHRRKAVLRELDGNAAFQLVSADAWRQPYPSGLPVADVATIPLVRRWLGDEAIQVVLFTRHYQGFSEADLARLAKVFPEAEQQEILPEPCHPGCFPRGTLVDTPQGPRAIEGIRVGDSLTAFLQGGELMTAQVQSIFVTSNRLWQVETEVGNLLTTETQPLCRADFTTLPAGKLQPGDEVLCRESGEIRAARVLGVSPTGNTAKVFNLVLGNSEIFIAGGFLARSKPPAEIASR